MRSEPEPRGTWERIYSVVDSIPLGRVSTYGRVAAEADLPGRARLVGTLLRRLPQGSALPWHRVLGADGKIPDRGHKASEREQARRLRAEGVPVSSKGRISLAEVVWPK